MAEKRPNLPKSVEVLRHLDETRANIPTAEYQSVVDAADKTPVRVEYERRNRDLDPQLVWRGKDEQDWSDLVVHAPPIYIQEKVHPKALIDDLIRRSSSSGLTPAQYEQIDLFADFDRVADDVDKTEFYEHEQGWTNRMILGDSLQVMASLAEREGLRGKVQCIYLDPPYGIKFNSNFQWSTTSRDVKDGNAAHITREPEQVRAFRDTWRDGVHSYLTYIRDRLTVARDLLTDSGSIFVQIGDENVHRIRSVMDEILGDENFVAIINFKSTNPLGAKLLPKAYDYIVWYAKRKEALKFRPLLKTRDIQGDKEYRFVEDFPSPSARRRLSEADLALLNDFNGIYRRQKLTSSGFTPSCTFPFTLNGHVCSPFGRKSWATNRLGIDRLIKADRLFLLSGSPYYKRYFRDATTTQFDNTWSDQPAATESIYVVQTATKFIQRCLLMTTDPGDLVLDPTCGSGTTAVVAEQWGRRWITIDTSRVALALARARLMGARFPFYLLADSPDGRRKEAQVTGVAPSSQPIHGDIRLGFVYERVPHITLKAIANNSEIDVIWEKWQKPLEQLRDDLNHAVSKNWQEWEIPRDADEAWSARGASLHAEWWEARIARQKEIDASISAKADFEYLYDSPYEDKKKVRVAGPFTVESLSPHRMLSLNEDDDLVDPLENGPSDSSAGQSFTHTILENLRTAGVQQAHKDDRIAFTSLTPWPGDLVCGLGQYLEGAVEKRAAIFIGPEFGTVQRADLVLAAREAGDAGFDVLIACAFNYEAHTTEFNKLGSIPVLKARMNADLHMADDLKNTGKGNLFVIFGEPDIDLLTDIGGQVRVKINGVDIFHPSTGEVQSGGADGIACWFIDTDYNEESFFVRHAYFLGANDPYSALKTTLKVEIDPGAWATLNSDISRPFDKPSTGRIAVKVINHLGDEVMKVVRVD